MKRTAAVVNRGWMGDAIACSAAAMSLAEKGYETTFFLRWPQLQPILDNDRRFRTTVYGRLLTYKVPRPLVPGFYDLVVREPFPWSYAEPLTSEIRRLAGCEPTPAYRLILSPGQIALAARGPEQVRPVIAFARDSYKRAYQRDIDELISRLRRFADVRWVGLDPAMDSKSGKQVSLVQDASIIYNSDLFVGPEGGLLWLAAGLGTRCVYFTEHIVELAKRITNGNPMCALGSARHFPDAAHIDLPAYCSNDEVVNVIVNILERR